MGTLLIERWFAGTTPIPIIDDASTALVRAEVRACAVSAGLAEAATESMVIAASELGKNQLVHAHRGSVAVRVVRRGAVGGIEIIAADEGNGILDPASALAGRSTGSGLGGGLSGTARLCDELDIDVRIGEGTCVRARKFAAELTRRPEIGVFGRPSPGESISGDDALYARHGDALLLAVADGLGHGPHAREASARAMDTFLALGAAAATDILAACDRALDGTRGAVMAVAVWDEARGELSHAAAGNVIACLQRRDDPKKLSGPAIVLGARRSARLRPQSETLALAPREGYSVRGLERDPKLMMFFGRAS